jgi:DNA-directed RNA polymerase III subunit RPC3
VAERFGHKVQSAGSMVTAALKLAAHKQHALKNQNLDERTVFSPEEIVNYLPKPVQQSLEKKPGGLLTNLSRALVEICNLSYPHVLSEVEQAAGNPNGGKFEIATRQLVNHLRDRIYHQVS